jgi:hypothetical protein
MNDLKFASRTRLRNPSFTARRQPPDAATAAAAIHLPASRASKVDPLEVLRKE